MTIHFDIDIEHLLRLKIFSSSCNVFGRTNGHVSLSLSEKNRGMISFILRFREGE